ncbi:hypothetical protein A2192_02725 [Candidatus Nomurabacteria bacterium RIFOXYA1_FULL_35_17]|uniref:ChsH2 rubredoxin-like zinc ribbon domain-containing protein n=4 Tax=Patescibacteria group TaxID=1783273 RepID=A0A1F6YIC6_9BACT|nr:MAG: hypothetical protein A2192_02725 [Candidatus Nomurabacteria bacterium RIFOXYA1_FULL_35_17]
MLIHLGRNNMEIPRHWRLRKQRYFLQGEICPDCDFPIFPPRDICPRCKHNTVGGIDYQYQGQPVAMEQNETEELIRRR